MFLLLFCCFAHKTSLVGVVDHVDSDTCRLELVSGEIIMIKSNICNSAKEGNLIYFYAKRKRK